MGFAARRIGALAEMVRVDTHWLAVRYADEPIPFWPVDYPAELEGNPSAPMCW